jgi:hypothetical protein
MCLSVWDEYKRLQQRASRCRHNDTIDVHEEQLDEFLTKYGSNTTPFDLHDCRRQQKNLARNRARKRLHRADALQREATWLIRGAAPDPVEEATRNDLLTRVKERVSSEEWRMLWGVATHGYTPTARDYGIPVGTLKARVSRCRSRLRRDQGSEAEPGAVADNGT